MIAIGIDPGFEGGIAAIEDSRIVFAVPMPVVGAKHRRIDGRGVAELLRKFDPANAVAFIEKVSSRPGQGVSSTFAFGKGVGMILGILETLGIPYYEPTPQQWKKAVLANTPKDKDAAIQHVHKRWPEVNLTPGSKRKPHDGIGDAVCLAEFGLSQVRNHA